MHVLLHAANHMLSVAAVNSGTDWTCHMADLNCSATDLPGSSLRWFFDYKNLLTYSYQQTHQYPLTVPSHVAGVLTFEIADASVSENNPDQFNFVAILRANISTTRLTGVTQISCGSFGTRSNTISLNSSNFETTSTYV